MKIALFGIGVLCIYIGSMIALYEWHQKTYVKISKEVAESTPELEELSKPQPIVELKVSDERVASDSIETGYVPLNLYGQGNKVAANLGKTMPFVSDPPKIPRSIPDAMRLSDHSPSSYFQHKGRIYYRAHRDSGLKMILNAYITTDGETDYFNFSYNKLAVMIRGVSSLERDIANYFRELKQYNEKH